MGTGSGIKVVAALRAMSAGQFGQYPLYVFCSDGIWAVPWSGTAYGAAQLISNDVAQSGAAIEALDSSVAYATGYSVNLLSGSKVVRISDAISGGVLEGLEVPYFSAVLTNAGIDGLSSASPVKRPGLMLEYDRQEQQLWVYDQQEAAIYSMVSQTWGMAASHDCALAVTQPFEIEDGLREIKISGQLGTSKPQLYLWGTQDFSSWTLVSSARAASLRGLAGTRFAYYCVAFSAPAARAVGGLVVSG